MKLRFLAYALGILLSGVAVFYLLSTREVGGHIHVKWEVLTEGAFIHEPRYSHVFFFDKKTGIAISSLSIERSDDGGVTWKTVPITGIQGYSSLVFTDNLHGWIVGTENRKPLIMRTGDGGLNWHKVNIDQKSSSGFDGKFTVFSDICFDSAGKSWIAGDGGIIEAVANGQDLKVSGGLQTKETLYDVSCNDSGQVWAVGRNGAVFQYQNSWSIKEVDKKYTFRRVLSKGSDVWILGGNSPTDDSISSGLPQPGVLLKSRDNGQTWENHTPESAIWLYDIFIRDGKGWLVGEGGSIYYSNDDGSSWIKYKSPTRNDLRKIFFLDSGNGWIVGGGATVLGYRS